MRTCVKMFIFAKHFTIVVLIREKCKPWFSILHLNKYCGFKVVRLSRASRKDGYWSHLLESVREPFRHLGTHVGKVDTWIGLMYYQTCLDLASIRARTQPSVQNSQFQADGNFTIFHMCINTQTSISAPVFPFNCIRFVSFNLCHIECWTTFYWLMHTANAYV